MAVRRKEEAREVGGVPILKQARRDEQKKVRAQGIPGHAAQGDQRQIEALIPHLNQVEVLITSWGCPRIDEDTIAMTIAALKFRWETDEAVEGISAFFDKRKAAWMG